MRAKRSNPGERKARTFSGLLRRCAPRNDDSIRTQRALGLSALLVRPDGFVAWAGETTPDLDEAVQAMSRWFGEPDEAR
ncbi:MAG TPA: hypothetical protein VNY10_12175 [Roseiarcus sp.]|nr:hypothetical protein [Roseiarcus sp.]